jgi:hypothetical protein
MKTENVKLINDLIQACDGGCFLDEAAIFASVSKKIARKALKELEREGRIVAYSPKNIGTGNRKKIYKTYGADLSAESVDYLLGNSDEYDIFRKKSKGLERSTSNEVKTIAFEYPPTANLEFIKHAHNIFKIGAKNEHTA